MTVDLNILVEEGYNGGKTEKEIIATIDFSGWHFTLDDKTEPQKMFKTYVRSLVAAAFQDCLQWNRPDIEFASDGITIHVTADLGSNWNDGRIWFVASISDMIDDYIERTNSNDMAGGDEARVDLAKCLSECLIKLNAAIAQDEAESEQEEQ